MHERDAGCATLFAHPRLPHVRVAVVDHVAPGEQLFLYLAVDRLSSPADWREGSTYFCVRGEKKKRNNIAEAKSEIQANYPRSASVFNWSHFTQQLELGGNLKWLGNLVRG